MRKLMSANGTEHSSVNAVKKKSSKPYYKKPTGDNVKSTSNVKIRNACYKCGSSKHKANFKSCPALGLWSQVQQERPLCKGLLS